jgi:retron-type reverse transcriptase
VNARRGKSLSVSALDFRTRLESELKDIRGELLAGTFRFGAYRKFTILDPKKRVICAAPFRERVVHHAMVRVIGPELERFQIHHSYACRVGKGTKRAVLQAFSWARSTPWYLKLDVRKYYDSIDHERLFKMLCGRFKDRRLLDLLAGLIDSYSTALGKGLPIGNLTSQYFANHYLGLFDHHAEARGTSHRYLRYMDDMLFFVPDVDASSLALREAEKFLSGNLSLELKPPVTGSTADGIPFLGFLVYPDRIRLLAANKRRFRRKGSFLGHALDSGYLSEKEAGDRANALVSVRSVAKCRALANSIWYGG